MPWRRPTTELLTQISKDLRLQGLQLVSFHPRAGSEAGQESSVGGHRFRFHRDRFEVDLAGSLAGIVQLLGSWERQEAPIRVEILQLGGRGEVITAHLECARVRIEPLDSEED